MQSTLAAFRFRRARAAFPAATLLVVALSASCGGGFQARLSGDGSARISVAMSVPEGPAKKLRELRSSGGTPLSPSAPLFDPAAIRKEIAGRKRLSLVSISAPTVDSIAAVVAVNDFAALVAEELSPSGFATIATKAGVTTLSVNITLKNAADISKLVPGLDRALIDSLAPPSLEGTAVTKDEYRMTLQAMFGKKNMGAIDSSTVTVEINVPGGIVASTGFPAGAISGSKAILVIPLIDLLVLERPISFSLSWK